MAFNLVVEAPDFERIKLEAGQATRDGTQLLWYVSNELSRRESADYQAATRTLSPYVQSDAPTAQQDNYDGQDATILLFTGGTAFNLTGIRNGREGRIYILANLGTGTITMKHESASSDAGNRIDMKAGVDKAVAQNQFLWIIYLSSRWREVSLA